MFTRKPRIEHGLGANETGDDTAAVDVADQDHGHVGGARKSHIGDVICAQVYLRCTARPLHQHDVGLRPETGETLLHGPHEFGLQPLVVSGLCLAKDAATHDDLRAYLALRLEKDGVHIDARCNACSPCLKRLGPTDLTAICGDGRVVRHVLRLEGQDLQTPCIERTRKARDDERLAHVRACALKHERAGGHG